MNILARLADLIDGTNEWVGRAVSWVTTGLVAVVFIDVVMRYLFNTSFVFTQELEWHLFGFIFLFGAGYTLKHDGHVRVDIIYQRLSTRARAWINLLGCIIFLFPGCLLIIITSIPFVDASFAVFEDSPDPGGIPARFILKACIPAGFVLFLMQGISMFIRSLLTLVGKDSKQEAVL